MVRKKALLACHERILAIYNKVLVPVPASSLPPHSKAIPTSCPDHILKELLSLGMWPFVACKQISFSLDSFIYMASTFKLLTYELLTCELLTCELLTFGSLAQVAAEHQQQQHGRRVENQGTQPGRRQEGPQHGRRVESQGSQQGRRGEGQGGHHSQQRRPPQQTGEGEPPQFRERHQQRGGGGARRQHQHRQRYSDSHDR